MMVEPFGSKPRRFIAGAVCPRCGAMDKIQVDGDGETRHCVACGYSDARPVDTGTVEPLSTRVTRPAARRVETQPEVIRLLDPSADSDEASKT